MRATFLGAANENGASVSIYTLRSDGILTPQTRRRSKATRYRWF